jgi:hypothetical protein
MKANPKKEVKEKNEEEAFKMLPNNIKQFFKEIDFNKEPDGNVRVKFMAVVPEANSFEIFLEVLDTVPQGLPEVRELAGAEDDDDDEQDEQEFRRSERAQK